MPEAQADFSKTKTLVALSFWHGAAKVTQSAHDSHKRLDASRDSSQAPGSLFGDEKSDYW